MKRAGRKKQTSRSGHVAGSAPSGHGAGRAIWSGHLTFGLVSIPVRVHSALSAGERVAFRLLHRKDHAPITYKKFCSREDVEVPADEIVRGYEVAKNEFSAVEREELDEVQGELGEGEHSIDLLQFVEPGSVDPLLFDRPYYLVPDDGGEKAYGLLRQVLMESGRIGIARLYLRRAMLAAVVPHGDVLVLQGLRPFEELRPAGDFTIGDRKASEPEKRMARALVDEMSAAWDPRSHSDRYRTTLEKLLSGRPRFALTEGEESAEKPAKGRGDVIDLMEALRRSVARTGERTPARALKKNARAAPSVRRTRTPRQRSARPVARSR